MKAPLDIRRDSVGKVVLWLLAAWYPVAALAIPARHQDIATLVAVAVALVVLLVNAMADFDLWGVSSWGFFLGSWVSGLWALGGFVRLSSWAVYFYLAVLGLSLPVLLWQMWTMRKSIPVDSWVVLVLFLAAVAASELAMVPAKVIGREALLGMLFFSSLEMFAVTAGMLHAASWGARSVAVAAMAEFLVAVMLLEPDYALFKPMANTAMFAIEAVPILLIPAIAYFCRSDQRAAWLSWAVAVLGVAAAVGFGVANKGTDFDTVERLVLVALPCVLAALLAVRIYPALPKKEEPSHTVG